MGRTVADAALLLSAQAGPDPRPVVSLSEPGSIFTPAFPNRLDGLRIAVSPDLGGTVVVDPEVAAMVEAQLATLTDLGATVTRASLDFTGADDTPGTQLCAGLRSAGRPVTRIGQAGDSIQCRARAHVDRVRRRSG
jgi:Asp-tRNA(Asn)/Glu-tRNA(Gln) amidotransferase A subunit family amidase